MIIGIYFFFEILIALYYIRCLNAHTAKIIINLYIQLRMDRTQIQNQVNEIIIDKLSVKEEQITPEAHFANDLGADSLDTVELIMEIEKKFNINIPDDQAENIRTVGQAIDHLEKNLPKK